MTLNRILLLVFVAGLLSCANQLNLATYQDYKRQGSAAEARGDWHTAEMAYYRAAENVRWGNLDPSYESTSLYDLGRAKRFVGKAERFQQIAASL